MQSYYIFDLIWYVMIKSYLLSGFVGFVTDKAESSRLATVILHDDTTHDLTVRLEQLKSVLDSNADGLKDNLSERGRSAIPDMFKIFKYQDMFEIHSISKKNIPMTPFSNLNISCTEPVGRPNLLEFFVREVSIPEVLNVYVGEPCGRVAKSLHTFLPGHEPS